MTTGVITIVLAVISVSWAEYSARSSCASAGSSAASSHAAEVGSATLIDEFMPEYQIREKHSILIAY